MRYLTPNAVKNLLVVTLLLMFIKALNMAKAASENRGKTDRNKGVIHD